MLEASTRFALAALGNLAVAAGCSGPHAADATPATDVVTASDIVADADATLTLDAAVDMPVAPDTFRPETDIDATPACTGAGLQYGLASFTARLAFVGGPVSASGFQFNGQRAPESPYDCDGQPDGPCFINAGQCQHNPDAGPANTAWYSVAAGDVTFSGARSGPITFSLRPDCYYDSYAAAPFQWSAGAMLTYTTTGADVPPIHIAVAAPEPVTFTTPAALVMDQAVDVDRSTPFAVQWTGGTGMVEISMGQQRTSTGFTCRFPSAGGVAMIPTSVLAHLAAGDATDVLIVVFNRTTSTVAGWNVRFDAEHWVYQQRANVR